MQVQERAVQVYRQRPRTDQTRPGTRERMRDIFSLLFVRSPAEIFSPPENVTQPDFPFKAERQRQTRHKNHHHPTKTPPSEHFFLSRTRIRVPLPTSSTQKPACSRRFRRTETTTTAMKRRERESARRECRWLHACAMHPIRASRSHENSRLPWPAVVLPRHANVIT